MQSHLVFLKLLKLIVALGFKCLFLLLKLGDRAFQILCEQLQLVLNRYVLSNVALILLQLSLKSDAVLVRIHAHIGHGRVSTWLKI